MSTFCNITTLKMRNLQHTDAFDRMKWLLKIGPAVQTFMILSGFFVEIGKEGVGWRMSEPNEMMFQSGLCCINASRIRYPCSF